MQELNYDLVFDKTAKYQYLWCLQHRKNANTVLSGDLFLDKVADSAGINIEILLAGFEHFEGNQFSKIFGNTGQLKLGHALYQNFFSTLSAERLASFFPLEHTINLRVVTDCTTLQSLPWQILAKEMEHLGATGFLINHYWSITLALPKKCHDFVKSPEISRVLMIAPDVQGFTATKGEAHIAILKENFRNWHDVYNRADALKVVTTWPALKKQLQAIDWDIIYFYGHASLDQ